MANNSHSVEPHLTRITLGAEESGQCRQVETRANVWTVCQKNGRCRWMAASGGSTVLAFSQ